MNEEKAEVGDEILLKDGQSHMIDMEDEGDAARDTDANDDENDDNILQDLHLPCVKMSN